MWPSPFTVVIIASLSESVARRRLTQSVAVANSNGIEDESEQTDFDFTPVADFDASN